MWSARSPTNGGDQRSPSRWIEKIESAIALARSSGGTAWRTTALIGEVSRKSERMQKKTRTKKSVGLGERKHATRERRADRAADRADAEEAAHRLALDVASSRIVRRVATLARRGSVRPACRR